MAIERISPSSALRPFANCQRKALSSEAHDNDDSASKTTGESEPSMFHQAVIRLNIKRQAAYEEGPRASVLYEELSDKIYWYQERIYAATGIWWGPGEERDL